MIPSLEVSATGTKELLFTEGGRLRAEQGWGLQVCLVDSGYF